MDRITLRKAATEETSPFWDSFVRPLLTYRRTTYLIVGVSMLVTLVYCVLISNVYTSTATILASGDRDYLSELKDVAVGSLGELGLGSVMQATENSSALYPSVLASRLISERVLAREFRFSCDGRPMSLSLEEYIDAGNRDRALAALPEIVQIDTDRRTGVISLSVTTRYPELSAAVVHAYLDELENYNLHLHQSKARDNERFLANRLTEVAVSLSQAEEELRAFRDKNRNYITSGDPTLQNELQRLQRHVAVEEAVFLALTKEHELAKVEAVKDIPVVRVLDRGSVPMVKSAPRRSVYLAGVLFASTFLGVILSLWFDLSRKRRVRTHFKTIVNSPEITFNGIESQVIDRATRLVNVLSRRREPVTKDQ